MNYNEIVKTLTDEKVIELLYNLGVDRHKETDDYIIFPTICHNTNVVDASMKLYYYKDSKMFYCYTDEGSMSVFNLLENYYTTRGIEYDWYDDIFRVVSKSLSISKEGFSKKENKLSEKYSFIKKEKTIPTYSKNILNVFIDYYSPEWLEDGITEATMKKYNIKYSISQNKIIIPHYNAENELVGIRGRALNKDEEKLFGKYMPVKIENVWYKHPLSLNLYGLNFNKENIKKTGIVFVFESEKSVLQMDGFYENNCSVAICGSFFNIYHLGILLRECNPKAIVFCFDKEEKEGENKYFYKLWKMGEKYLNYADFYFLYDVVNLLDLKDSPSDKGKDVFEKLLEKKVKIRKVENKNER